MPPSPAAPSARRSRTALTLTGIVLLILIGLGVVALRSDTVTGHSAAPTVVAPPTIDPRLVLHPHRLALTAMLTHGVLLTGAMAPDLPGPNTFDIALQGSGMSHPHRGSHLRLAASMPGMAMPPVSAILTTQGGHFTGTMALPMFGTYHLTVTVVTTAGTATGMLTITIPLPHV